MMAPLAPPPPPDPSQIETRLIVVAEMLDRAVAEVERALALVKGEFVGQPDSSDPPDDEAPIRRNDV